MNIPPPSPCVRSDVPSPSLVLTGISFPRLNYQGYSYPLLSMYILLRSYYQGYPYFPRITRVIPPSLVLPRDSAFVFSGISLSSSLPSIKYIPSLPRVSLCLLQIFPNHKYIYIYRDCALVYFRFLQTSIYLCTYLSIYLCGTSLRFRFLVLCINLVKHKVSSIHRNTS